MKQMISTRNRSQANTYEELKHSTWIKRGTNGMKPFPGWTNKSYRLHQFQPTRRSVSCDRSQRLFKNEAIRRIATLPLNSDRRAGKSIVFFLGWSGLIKGRPFQVTLSWNSCCKNKPTEVHPWTLPWYTQEWKYDSSIVLITIFKNSIDNSDSKKHWSSYP